MKPILNVIVALLFAGACDNRPDCDSITQNKFELSLVSDITVTGGIAEFSIAPKDFNFVQGSTYSGNTLTAFSCDDHAGILINSLPVTRLDQADVVITFNVSELQNADLAQCGGTRRYFFQQFEIHPPGIDDPNVCSYSRWYSEGGVVIGFTLSPDFLHVDSLEPMERVVVYPG